MSRKESRFPSRRSNADMKPRSTASMRSASATLPSCSRSSSSRSFCAEMVDVVQEGIEALAEGLRVVAATLHQLGHPPAKAAVQLGVARGLELQRIDQHLADALDERRHLGAPCR